jgi:hypothetical protein
MKKQTVTISESEFRNLLEEALSGDTLFGDVDEFMDWMVKQVGFKDEETLQ